MFSRKKIYKGPNGTEITVTKNKTQISYPNGDFDVIDHKRGTRSNHALINDDGTRTRDGK